MIVSREFEVKTGGCFDAVDVTGEVEQTVAESGVGHGSVLVFSPHTTCSVIVGVGGAETARSLQATLDAIQAEDGYYAHDDLAIRTENLVEDEPANAPAHILHAVVGKTSETIPVVDGRVVLGDGQRVLFVELDASRPRRYLIQVLGE
ncbi:MAG: secondary thiamine-phosphate synthase enzyme YjbQ [Actinobacteria bacterium]|nr:secondary thiamine-phosphate synthase enzyme YjbQ [Actinomycetota bacterium]